MIKMKLSLLIIFILVVLGCSHNKSFELVEVYGQAQGSTFQVKYLTEKSIDFQKSIDSIFLTIDLNLSTWQPKSAISALNEGSTIDLQQYPDLSAVIDSSKVMYDLTNRQFDITIGPIIQFWGFHRKNNKQIPDSTELDSLILKTGWNQVIRNESKIRLNKGASLDVNGLAQGYTVDRIAFFLEKKGIENYMVEVGGEVKCKGYNSNKQLWSIGIDKPTENRENGQFQAIVEIDNMALATSGNYRKYVQDAVTGYKYGHSISPMTGYPLQDPLLSATVFCKSSTRADALGTAFMVMGYKKSLDWLKSHPEVQVYFVYSDKKGDLKTFVSPELAKKLK